MLNYIDICIFISNFKTYFRIPHHRLIYLPTNLYHDLLSVAVLIRQLSWNGRDAGLGSKTFQLRRPVRRWLADQTIGLEASIVLQTFAGECKICEDHSPKGENPFAGALKWPPGGLRGAVGRQAGAKAARKPTLSGSWALLGHFWRLLGSSWGFLGRSWALSGRSLGSFWPPGRFLVEPFWVSFSGGFEQT